MLANVRVFLLIVLALLLSIYVSWMANAELGYGYSWLYDVYQTDKHIEQYAPENRYRHDFEMTDSDEHKVIFQQIVESVHNNGKGLKSISYTANGKTYSFLHRAEIIHLQDVALLINHIHIMAAMCLVLFMFLYVMPHFVSEGIIASTKGVISVFLIMVVVIGLIFSIIGAKAIFYQFHIWIFPDNHQWFFYYQDSLMSTLMKAPDLFGGIAIQILVLGLIIFMIMLGLFKKYHLKMKALNNGTVKKEQGLKK
jgi:uncharacterized membrane protein